MIKYKKVLILGSGALKIGEAGEFDYSGSQAVKALKEEGIYTILINPNIATIQTSRKFADQIYFLPVNPFFVERVIVKERPDGILLSFGGQTALNCGLDLAKREVFKKYGVDLLGTPITSIEKTEDRLLFRKSIEKLGLKVPRSILCKSLKEVKTVGSEIIYPVIIRAGFSLGGLGSGVARDPSQLMAISGKALTLSPQILIEEYLEHWKEIEYEVVRDSFDNTITVCNMENFDPMGVHTGESIVVAPSQTLNNHEYQILREVAIKVVKSLPIIGECNIQFAQNPKNGDYRIIEVNARLSRSSALASKATGYPLAYVAAKLALGYALFEIPNQVTKATSSFFEPALDYVVVKIPRWDFLKFKDVDEIIGSEMQSVGEVMAIGRSFEEALQKGIRSLDLDYEGVISDELDSELVKKRNAKKITFKNLNPTPGRIYNIAFNLFYNQDIKDIEKETGINSWFIERIKNLISFYKQMLRDSEIRKLTYEKLRQAKQLGFSDQQIGEVFAKKFGDIRQLRKKWKITPKVCQIDTLSGEFPAKTNYLYFSYNRNSHDIKGNGKKQVGIVGGGPYQIGSSVEFDWCAVNSVLTAKKMGYFPIMINCNPETVSTDYDISDKLYFEELTLERILDIVDFEKCPLIVSVGGQIPNTLSSKLEKEGVKLLGTESTSIDKAEDRKKFSELLDRLGIEQPIWAKFISKKEAIKFVKKIGFPVLVRPSYVLSGRAMFVAYAQEVLESFLETSSSIVNPEYPVVISKFVRGAKEVDFDAVSQKGEIKVWAISEHVEHAGVHSGDSTLVLPSFSLSDEAIEQIKKTSQKVSFALEINGPFNIQYLVNEDGRQQPEVLVIEANIRASRSFPFVSKVLGVNFIEISTKIMLGEKVGKKILERPPYFGVKVPHFSFTRLRQVDPVLRVEMTSTGEVACFDDDLRKAYLKALLSTGISLPEKTALLSLGGDEAKQKLLHSARLLHELGYSIYATQNTSEFLKVHSIPANFVYKVHEKGRPNVEDLIRDKKVSLVINLSDRSDLGVKELSKEVTDGYLIRRATVDANIPLFTKATIASLFVSALSKFSFSDLNIKPWGDYLEKYQKKY